MAGRMKTSGVLACAIACTLALGVASPTTSVASAATPDGFRVTYQPARSAVSETLREMLAKHRVFESVADTLNRLVQLPRPVDIQLAECRAVNAFYDPKRERVTVCYELVGYFAGVFEPAIPDVRERGTAVIGATMFAFFHEVGHGLIDVLDLPAVGREEDSADQLATLLLLRGGEKGAGLALAGAHWFQLQLEKQKQRGKAMNFANEHSFDGQRFYNILCMIYGSDPTRHADLVAKGTLPRDRATRCPAEYAKIKKAWDALLAPHLIASAPTVKPGVNSIPPWAREPRAADRPRFVSCRAMAEAVGGADTRSQCLRENWSQDRRRCVMDAPTTTAALRCGNG